MLKLFAVLSLSVALLAGCASPEVAAYRVEGIVVTTVDTGMQAWKEFVVSGQSNKSQVQQVKDAYDKYYNSQLLAKAAFEKAMATKDGTTVDQIATANKSVADAEAALITLIQSFLTKTHIPKPVTTPD